MSIVVVGLGASGLSVVKYYRDRHIPVSVVDSRESPPNLVQCQALYPEVAIYTGGFPATVLEAATTLVLSPGIHKEHPDIVRWVHPSVEVIGDIELFAREARAPIVAITGSNGKSTVTTLVGAMAQEASIKVAVGGNIGVPVLSFLSKGEPEKTFAGMERTDSQPCTGRVQAGGREDELYVLELSSFQLETTHSLQATAAVILNLSADHLDRYPSMDAYYAAKRRIYRQCKYRVFNRDEPMLVQDLPARDSSISFGLGVPLERHYGLTHERDVWLARGKTRLLPISRLKLFGAHNIANVLAALALGECISLPLDSMLATVEKFTGLPHRCEWVRNHNDVLWINDSKGTNVGATRAALEGLGASIQGKWVLIAGGIGKQADFSPLKALVRRYCRAVVLIGEAAEALHSLLGTVAPCVKARDLQEAVMMAKQSAHPGDGVLLSPACSSFDMFANFEERGNIFKALVGDL